MIYQDEDKNNGNLNRAMMGRFCRLLDDTEIKEINLLGCKFTWSNERQSPTLVRVDRVFSSIHWERIFPDFQSAASSVSDHCPLLLGLKVNIRGNQRFHFECFWPSFQDVHEVVSSNWEAPVAATCPIERFYIKLKILSRGLQGWSPRRVSHILISSLSWLWPKRSSTVLK